MGRLKNKPLPIENLSAEAKALYEVLSDESDLACVVISAAFLDSVLGSLLQSKLLDSSVTKKILNSNGFLGNFASRADMTYVLSLIKKEEYHDTCLIEEIRNLFAHSHLKITFGEKDIQDLCQNLHSADFILSGLGQEISMPTCEQLSLNARNRFNITVIHLVNRFLLTGIEIRKNTIPKE